LRPLGVLPLLCLLAAAAAHADPADDSCARLDAEAMDGVTRLLGLDGAEPARQWGARYGESWHIESLRPRPVTKGDGQIVRFSEMPLPLCFLTYDCERGSASTTQLLSELNRSDSRATGFWLGSFVASAGDLLRQWRAAGHEAGLHSYGHAVQTSLSTSGFAADLERAEAAVIKATGAESDRVYRYPYGEGNGRLTEVVSDHGFRPFFWTIDTNDWRGRSGSQVAASIQAAGPGDIALMHDTPGAIDAACRAVEALRAKGLEPAPLSWAAAAYPAQPVFMIPGPVKPVGRAGERPEPAKLQVAYAPAGDWLAVVADGALALWDRAAHSGVRVAQNVAWVDWSPEGSMLLVTTLAPDSHVYLLDPGVTAAACASDRGLAITALPGAVRLSTPGSRNHAAAFVGSGAGVEWIREGPSGPAQRVRVSLRRQAPWAVVSVYGASGAKVTLTRSGGEVTATAPCRLTLPLTGAEASAMMMVEGATAYPLRLRVDVERGVVTEANLAEFMDG
jgi:peptidoglycan/xylan/chitin deacetylase (PgdA/CDA1 family)